MKRLHLHIKTNDLQHSIEFYAAMFGTAPTVQKADYAKWLLDDPAANISLSAHGNNTRGKTGIDHAGISLDDNEDLEAIADRLDSAGILSRPEKQTTCCYAQSNKHWTQDPQGTVWELFHTFDESSTYGNQPALAPVKADVCCTAQA